MLHRRDNWKDWMEPEDMVCRNCGNFAAAIPVSIPVDEGFMERRLCRKAEFYGDAGADAVTLVGPESDCFGAGTCAFIPSVAYMRKEAGSAVPPSDDYGVRPGADYPVTMFPEPQARAV